MVSKKRIIKHIEKDTKEFKREIAEDKKLLKDLKKKKNKAKGKK